MLLQRKLLLRLGLREMVGTQTVVLHLAKFSFSTFLFQMLHIMSFHGSAFSG